MMRTLVRLLLLMLSLMILAGCTEQQEIPVKDLKPDVPYVDSKSSLESEIDEQAAKLDSMKKNVQTKLDELRQKQKHLNVREAELDSLQKALETKELELIEREAELRDLQRTARWLIIITVLLLVIALYLLFRPKKRSNDNQPPIVTPVESTGVAGFEAPVSERAKEKEKPSEETSEEDDLVAKAREIVVNSGKATITLVQDDLNIGRARAMKILEELEKQGVVGPSQQGRGREVLIKPDDSESKNE